MKTLYLPFVLEKDLRKGYSAVDEDEAWGFISLYLYRIVSGRRPLFGKYEKINEIYAVNYPFILKCFGEGCFFFDAGKKLQIKDHGIVGSLALLSNYSSMTPYLIDSLDLSCTQDVNIDGLDKEYSVPILKSGEGIYRLTFLRITFKDKNSRTLIQPPIYYIPPTGLYGDLVLREFSEFKRVFGGNDLTLQLLHIQTIDRLELHRRIVFKIKNGLEKLVDKKFINANVVLKIMLLFE